nr:RabGAP/TBC domain-containing protein [Tanacetum cinerariifolium]
MSFSKRPGKNTPQCYTKPLDSLKNWNNRFFWVDECVFPTAVEWRTNASKDEMSANGTYSVEAVRALDTHRNPIQKQPEMLLCLVGISRRYYLGDEVYPTFHYDDDQEMDLFSLIRAPNPTKVKTGSRPRAPHELPLLTLTPHRVIEMDEPAAATDSSGGDRCSEVPPPEEVPIATASGTDQAMETVAVEPPAVLQSRKRGHEGIDTNAPPKSLRRDHADFRPSDRVRLMHAILLTYSFYNFDLGYCQGMSDLLSSILFILQDESEAFWCFVSLLERLGPNFNCDHNGMHYQLFALSKVISLSP